jgi:acyl-CoA synthetase (AMP-forming)/AMP-acid ligase II
VDLARSLIGRINVGDSLTRTAVSRPDQLAVVDGDRRLTYRALNAYVTERSPCTTLFRPEHQLSHIGAVGTPLIGVQVAIMGPAGTLLPPGQAGEIVYRGPSTMSGYLHDEEATDKAFAHGWFHSGDVGYFGDDAFIVPKRGETIDGAELIAALKARLDGFKVPKAVIFVDQLPKTSTGKIQKNVVRSDYAKHYEEG